MSGVKLEIHIIEVKLSIISDAMVLYLENFKDYKNALETLNSYNKVAGYKINVQKLMAFLYQQWKRRKILKIPFKIVFGKIKKPGNQLNTKEEWSIQRKL